MSVKTVNLTPIGSATADIVSITDAIESASNFGFTLQNKILKIRGKLYNVSALTNKVDASFLGGGPAANLDFLDLLKTAFAGNYRGGYLFYNSKHYIISGMISHPKIDNTPATTLTFPDTADGATAVLPVVISAYGLTADIAASRAGAGAARFTFSATEGGAYTTTLTIPKDTNGNVSTTIYVKFSPNAVAAFAADISLASAGATTKVITASGNGI